MNSTVAVLYDSNMVSYPAEDLRSGLAYANTKKLLKLIPLPQAKRVLIKPNFGLATLTRRYAWACNTHASVIQAIIDSLPASAEITVADSPLLAQNWRRITALSGADKLTVRPVDLRSEPRGYVAIDLTESRHNRTVRYHVSRAVLDAELVISVPKLKVHRKAGVSLSLKNVMGIASGKHNLPHYSQQDFSPYPPAERLKRLLSLRPTATHGNWSGNDTLWRTILDLNRILLYADADGDMHSEKQRRCFAVIDGVIGSEGNAPMHGKPRVASTLIASSDLVAADVVGAKIMGLDSQQIPHIYRAVEFGETNFSNIDILPDRELRAFNFELPHGWMAKK